MCECAAHTYMAHLNPLNWWGIWLLCCVKYGVQLWECDTFAECLISSVLSTHISSLPLSLFIHIVISYFAWCVCQCNTHSCKLNVCRTHKMNTFYYTLPHLHFAFLFVFIFKYIRCLHTCIQIQCESSFTCIRAYTFWLLYLFSFCMLP